MDEPKSKLLRDFCKYRNDWCVVLHRGIVAQSTKDQGCPHSYNDEEAPWCEELVHDCPWVGLKGLKLKA